MLYLDTSALTKLVLPEPESAVLRSFLEEGSVVVTSALTRTELTRAAMRHGAGNTDAVSTVLSVVAFVSLRDELLDAAGRLAPTRLRSLDAIHLASALTLRDDLDAFVAYDARLVDAAAALGLPVASPG